MPPDLRGIGIVQFGERPETILETLREDSRIDMVAPEGAESVVKAQLRNGVELDTHRTVRNSTRSHPLYRCVWFIDSSIDMKFVSNTVVQVDTRRLRLWS